MAERPLLITVIAVLTILSGLVCLLAGGIAAMISEEMWNDLIQNVDVGDLTLSYIHVFGFGLLALGIFSLIVGFALWKGWTFAWYLALILFLIQVVYSAYSIIMGIWFSAISLVIYAVLVYYLFTPRVKGFFNV